MKKLIILLILLLPIVFAQETYNQGSSTASGGHSITVVSIGQSSVVFSVDGVKDIVSLNQDKIINGVRIFVTEIFYAEETESRYIKASFAATTEVATGGCGDGVCGDNEDKTSCCKDCGCSGANYTCSDNGCIKNECTDDEKCWDQNYCDRDRCEGTPKKCVHTAIIECVVNDKCCPGVCYYPDDPDCPSDKLNPNPSQVSKSDTTEVTEGVNITKEGVKEGKIGFFRKIIKWFLSLFGKK